MRKNDKVFVKPWSKEAENILRQLSLSGRAYSINNPQLPREFGMRCKDIINRDLLDIATVRTKKTHRTWYVTPPDIIVTPKPNQKGVYFHFRRFKIL